MTPQTPYSADLGSREPLSALRETMARIQTLASGWAPAQFERTYAPGKWTAREILTHLAQTELALGNRARMALATPGYTAQSFDQDRWMAQETGASAASRGSRGATGPVALEALVALNAMNRALFESLTPAERATPFAHPEYGALTIDWLIHQMAGHALHHLKQLDQIEQL
ncbi:MAG TPA: DinB family protein [Vicinamibacterales bacterium]|jgi:hypothetical protein|nr:DinB family protein [Vicinamibacterales bacterium]